MTEWWGKEITESDEGAPLAGHFTAGNSQWNRPSKGRFCVFREGDAYRTESCVIEKPLGLWLRGR